MTDQTHDTHDTLPIAERLKLHLANSPKRPTNWIDVRTSGLRDFIRKITPLIQQGIELEHPYIDEYRGCKASYKKSDEQLKQEMAVFNTQLAIWTNERDALQKEALELIEKDRRSQSQAARQERERKFRSEQVAALKAIGVGR